MVSNLRIVADANIPCVEQAFGHLATIEQVPGRSIGPTDVSDADVLLVRSVTRVGPSLLEDSPVQFVGSATIGTDHVDRKYLDDEGIAFAHAPGSNADSVADYVVAAVLALARQFRTSLQGQTLGVVGCGDVGSRVGRRLAALGLSVLRNDPPRVRTAADSASSSEFVPLDRVLQEASIVTLHVPLTLSGRDATHHLVDEEALQAMSRDAWLLNTSRGPVVDNDALLRALEAGEVEAAVLDVWEDEPTPDPALVGAVDIATPHIAGYAHDGKVRGTTMLYRALCEHLGVDPVWTPDEELRPATPDRLHCHPADPRLPRTEWLHQLTRQAYDIVADDARLRRMLNRPRSEHGDYFRRLRASYPMRRELQQHTVPGQAIPDEYRRAVEEGLTIPFRHARYDR